jgi:hypothetical protein
MNKPSLLLLSLAGCWTSSQPTTSPPVPDVMVELAAVTLADDCGSTDLPPPVAAADKPRAGAPASMAPMPPGDICEGCVYTPHCDQTSMQLSLRTTGGGSTNVTVKKVELLDSRGKFLANLDARMPTRWDGQRYVGWDQKIVGEQKLAASYLLSAPDWNALTGNRWNAHTKSFQLRVTLAVGNSDRTVDKQSITPAMLEPPVPT